MMQLDRKEIILLIGSIVAVYLLGMYCIDIMDVDASQYASISREMWETGNYLQIQHRGTDYLDKPPLLFWLSAWSFELFGPHQFFHRLPTFLSTIVGAWATFRLGKTLYTHEVGILAGLFLVTCQGYFLVNHDVRTDTLMINFMVFGVWQLYEYIHHQKRKNFLWAVVGVGLSMLAKGPIGLVVPMLAVGGYLLYERNWKMMFRWEWLLGILLIGLILLPMSIGLYQQHDWEGVRFYYWTQSFGRITGENRWRNDAGFFYFIPTYLWSFLPWIILFFVGFGSKCRELFTNRFQKVSGFEVLTFSGFILPFLALSFSKYKLPHYVYVTLPFAAIITAQAIPPLLEKAKTYKVFFMIHTILVVLIWLFLAFLSITVFPLKNAFIIIGLLFFIGLSIYFLQKSKHQLTRLIFPIAFAFVGANFFLNTHFYPNLLKYQAPSQIGRYITENNLPIEDIYCIYTNAHSLDFYSKSVIEYRNEAGIKEIIKEKGSCWLFTTKEGIEQLGKHQIPILETKSFEHYHIAMLKIQFLNPATRSTTLKERYLIKVGT